MTDARIIAAGEGDEVGEPGGVHADADELDEEGRQPKTTQQRLSVTATTGPTGLPGGGVCTVLGHDALLLRTRVPDRGSD